MWERSLSKDEDDISDDDDNVDGNKEDDLAGEWELTTTLEGPDSEIKSVAFSSSSTGNLVATCSRDKSVWIWECLGDGEYETISVLMGQHTQDVKCLAWYPGEDVRPPLLPFTLAFMVMLNDECIDSSVRIV